MGFVDGSKRPEQNVGRKPMRFASPFAMADNKNDGRWLPTPKEDSVSSPRFSKPCTEVDSVLALSPINAHDVIGKPKHAEPAALLSDGCSRSTHLELAEIPARTPSSWPVIIQNGGLISNAKLPFYPHQSVDGEGITLMESRPTRWKLDNLQSRLAPPSSKRNKPEGLKQCSLRACSSPEAPWSSHTRDLASYYIDDEALLNPITATSGNVSLSPGGKDSENASSPLNVEGKQGDCDAATIASISSADFLKRGILSKEVFEPGTCEAPKLPITDANCLDVLGGSYCHEGTMESFASRVATNSLEALPTEGPDQSFTEISIDYQWKPVGCGSCQKLGHRNCKPSELSRPTVSSSGSVHSSKTCSIFPSLEKVYSSGNLCLDDLSTAVERGCSYVGPPDTPSKMKVQSSSGSPMADSGQVKKLVAGEDDQGIGKQRKNIEKIQLQLGASSARVPELEDDVGMSSSEGFGTDIPSFLSGEGLSPATEGGGSQSCLKKPKRVRRNTKKELEETPSSNC
ncbi:hypothetical protein Nepgr_031684 [Nepenthes gracilis]|uniref:Uncharacterized protein n=1 Tax=Nepenthes gracilis TaxID=150966 RepID=A0AAD3TIZ2_NEPGR|nr:hypothetical protein Nepgr_031684 [Nepenthes gracilis]